MSTHATLSPSARHRWQLCPASVKACAQYADEEGKSNASAVDGTHTHTLLEQCINHALNPPIDDPERFVGTILQDHEGSFAVDKERAARVRVATDYIRNRCKELGDGVTIISERRVDPQYLVGRDDMSGTVDVQIIKGDVIELIDYKDGMSPVNAVDNPQLDQYAISVLSENAAKEQPHFFNLVVTTIIQPKLAMKGMPPITSSISNASDYYGKKLIEIIEEANATDDPEPKFVAGEKQCGWCRHKGNCTTFAEHTLQQSGIKFENMQYAKDAAQSDPAVMSDEKLRELVEAAPLLRKLIESAEEEALRRLQSGKVIAGLKVVRGSGRRQWKLPEDDIAEKLKKMQVPMSSIWETKLVSPAQAEKLRWVKKDGTEKQLTARQLEVINTELVSKSEGKLTVVPEADHRAGVAFADMSTMFQAVPDIPSWLS